MVMAKVFLIEDDLFISDIIETKLKQADFEVETTADGRNVISKLDQGEYDLILLDLMLPNKHGFEVLKEIRDDATHGSIPVIILSNENGPDVEQKASELNAKYYFKAMTDMNELVKIVKEALPA